MNQTEDLFSAHYRFLVVNKTPEDVLTRSIFREGHCAMPPPPLSTLPFTKKEQNEWFQVTEICQTFLMVSVAYGQGQIQMVG